MATAPPLPYVSVADYLRTDYEPHCEYLEGVLAPKALPDYIHSRLQALLLLLIAAQSKKLGIEVMAELRLRVTPTRWRIPDICALTRPPVDGKYPDFETPPLFTIEIVSKGEAWTDLRDKLTDHLAMGVSTVILADPHSRTVLVATQSEPLHEIAIPMLVSITVPDVGTLQIDFDDLYRGLTGA